MNIQLDIDMSELSKKSLGDIVQDKAVCDISIKKIKEIKKKLSNAEEVLLNKKNVDKVISKLTPEQMNLFEKRFNRGKSE